MNKSISISLGGRVFFIEEDAYQKLYKYIEQIRVFLRNETDIDEIISDIEYRISELFYEYLTQNREVIHNNDVEKIINILGNPENFSNDEELINSEIPENKQTQQKSLYRDFDNKLIGGVISGIAKYFNQDVVWFRLILVLGVFIGTYYFDLAFFPIIIIYIILMILVPYAKSTSDKLKMEGKPINLESIKEQFSISEENKSGIQQNVQKVSNGIGSFAEILGKFIMYLFGAIFICIGFSLMIAFFAFLSDYFFGNKLMNLDLIGQYIYEKDWKYYLAINSGAIFWFITSYLLIILGFKLLVKNFRYQILRKINIAFLFLWIFSFILGIIMISFIGMDTAKDFTIQVQKNNSEIIKINSDTLNIYWNDTQKDENGFITINNNDFLSNFFEVNKNGINQNLKNEIEIRSSETNDFMIEILYESKGKDGEDAKQNLSKIQYKYKIEGNNLILNTKFHLPKNSKFRTQFVHPIIYIPKNKFIKTSGIEHIYTNNKGNWEDFYDIKTNIFNYRDNLKCLDCKNDDLNNEDQTNQKINKLKNEIDSIKNNIK